MSISNKSDPLARKQNKYGPWMMNPLVVSSAILIGISIGIFQKEWAIKLALIGDIYLALLEMCVLPILVSAIVSGLGRLLGNKNSLIQLTRLLIVFVSGLMLASAVGLGFGLLMQPGSNMNHEDRITLGRQLISKEQLQTDQETTSPTDLGQIIVSIIPKNIFASISKGPSLAVLFFSILFGCALGLVRTQATETVLTLLEGIYSSFLKIIFWILYALPIGMIGLFSGQVARSGPDIFLVLSDLVLACALSTIVLLSVYTFIIWYRVGTPLFPTLKLFQQTFTIALTSSAFATIPSALQALNKGLGVPKETAHFIFPLGINLNRHGSVFQFALASVFMAQLYSMPLDFGTILIIWLGSMLAGMAALGGLPGLGMLAIVLQLLNLPSQVAIVLITSIDSIMIPMLVLVSVYANCAMTVLVCPLDEFDKPTV